MASNGPSASGCQSGRNGPVWTHRDRMHFGDDQKCMCNRNSPGLEPAGSTDGIQIVQLWGWTCRSCDERFSRVVGQETDGATTIRCPSCGALDEI